jgi:TonB family protein
MRISQLTALLFLMASTAIAHISAPTPAPAAPLSKEPAEIFAAAAPSYDFASPALKPWHMKVSHQLYDDHNKPSAQGSYEYWWASPDTYRSTWSRSGMEQTDWYVNGQHSHAGSGEPLEYFERKLKSDLLEPMPKAEDLDPEKFRLERQQQSFGTVKLPCVMVIHKMPLHAQVQTVPLGMFPNYCFEPQIPVLRVYYAFGSTSVVYNNVVRFQGVYLPRKLGILEGKRKVLTATVDSIETTSSEAPELTPAKEAARINPVKNVSVSSGVATTMLKKEIRPVYSEDAKQLRIQGTVVLQAMIGTDGHIHDLKVIDGPSPSLVGAAMWAVSQWEYKPYLLYGEQVEVNTTINVVFRMDR